ncbi:unnamed protein product [Echinostoma caproni]|uniref:Secreted protein n=1 Tax=Echinostoma caproni TaxID=27848 RepID=A0A183A4P0_9TREM|nr:unnamed protein product [Echinostoma caproni]
MVLVIRLWCWWCWWLWWWRQLTDAGVRVGQVLVLVVKWWWSSGGGGGGGDVRGGGGGGCFGAGGGGGFTLVAEIVRGQLVVFVVVAVK